MFVPRLVFKALRNVKKEVHWVQAIWEGKTLQPAAYLVKSGQLLRLTGTNSLMWESTTTAGIQMLLGKEEFGVTPQIIAGAGRCAQSPNVRVVREEIP